MLAPKAPPVSSFEWGSFSFLGGSPRVRVGHLPLFPSMGSFGSRRLSSSYLSAIPVIDLIYRGKKVEGFMVTRAFAKLGPLELLKYKPLSQHTGTTKGCGLARTGTHTGTPGL